MLRPGVEFPYEATLEQTFVSSASAAPSRIRPATAPRTRLTPRRILHGPHSPPKARPRSERETVRASAQHERPGHQPGRSSPPTLEECALRRLVLGRRAAAVCVTHLILLALRQALAVHALLVGLVRRYAAAVNALLTRLARDRYAIAPSTPRSGATSSSSPTRSRSRESRRGDSLPHSRHAISPV
jgi:hypothetical protein